MSIRTKQVEFLSVEMVGDAPCLQKFSLIMYAYSNIVPTTQLTHMQTSLSLSAVPLFFHANMHA